MGSIKSGLRSLPSNDLVSGFREWFSRAREIKIGRELLGSSVAASEKVGHQELSQVFEGGYSGGCRIEGKQVSAEPSSATYRG